jgi:hypothetical protein
MAAVAAALTALTATAANGVMSSTSLRYSIHRWIDDHDEVAVSEGDWAAVSLL